MRRYGESEAHERQKERVGSLLSAQGWTVWVDSYPFECETRYGTITYWPDVYAESPEYRLAISGPPRPTDDELTKAGAKRIIVEIQGKGGHNTKLAFTSDKLRIQDIWECHGFDIRYYELQCRSKKSRLDIRNWSDQEILEEIEIE